MKCYKVLAKMTNGLSLFLIEMREGRNSAIISMIEKAMLEKLEI